MIGGSRAQDTAGIARIPEMDLASIEVWRMVASELALYAMRLPLASSSGEDDRRRLVYSRSLLKPGCQSSRRQRHVCQDDILLVIAGRGTLH